MPNILTKIKLQAPGGSATPAPPVGPALGQHGVNINDFVTRFNEMTADMKGDIIPVEVTIFEDRTMELVLKTPPAAELLKKAAGVKKGSGNPNVEKIGTVTKVQVREITEKKMADLSARDVEQGMKIIEGSARSMGITVK